MDVLLFGLFAVSNILIRKCWKAMDIFLNEKAKNIATKQDIAVITQRTEAVKEEFKESFERFHEDLQFKYSLYEKQYKELYVKLYFYVCKSEANREVACLDNDIDISFEHLPIIEYSFGNDVAEEKLHKQMIELIEEQCIYASPQLLKIVSRYQVLEKTQMTGIDEQFIQEQKRKLKILLVQNIVNDFQWLRKELFLPYQDEGDMNNFFFIRNNNFDSIR